MAALNSQTAVQFQQYAAQQYPGSLDQQQLLVRQLQEQHYQQYMQQLYQAQLAQQQVRRGPLLAGLSRSAPLASKENVTRRGLVGRLRVHGQLRKQTGDMEAKNDVTTGHPGVVHTGCHSSESGADSVGDPG